jgi:FkbM family methyltransferase
MFKKIIINNFAFLGKYKRLFVALRDNVLSTKYTYSQHQEDVFIKKELGKYDLKGSIYIDVGANHPTDISNTYMLYRMGYSGIIIEPNQEFSKLYSSFRRKDIVLGIGCGNKAEMLKFNISKTPVISSFSNERDINIYKSVYVPIMPLDSAVKNIYFSFVSLLNIDVEGLNYEVLEGALQTLKKSLLICIEYDTPEEEEKIKTFLINDFAFIKKVSCNLFFLNRDLSSRLRK